MVTVHPRSRDRGSQQLRRLRQTPANQRRGSQIQPHDSHQYSRWEHQLQQPIYDHPGHYKVIDSDGGSVRTIASIPQSDISASTVDSTDLLAHQWRITPCVLTPTSSEASDKVYDDNTVVKRYFRGTGPERHAEQRATANCTFTILLVGVCKLILPVSSPINEALQGLETPFPHHNRSPDVPENPLSPPLGQLAALPGPSPPYGGPWNSLQFRFENPGIQQVGKAGDRGEGASTSRGGVRHQPLTPDQREEANKTRQIGACLRCRLFKEKVRGNASEIFGTADATCSVTLSQYAPDVMVWVENGSWAVCENGRKIAGIIYNLSSWLRVSEGTTLKTSSTRIPTAPRRIRSNCNSH